MELQLRWTVLFGAIISLVLGDIYSFGIGNYPPTGSQLHIIHAKKGPVEEPEYMELKFDYIVSPVDNVEITYVNITASLSNGGAFANPTYPNLPEGFIVIVTARERVKELQATATVYGIRNSD
ncbi:uncharacterized protein LOC134205915 [Armigeres subalbatus]|uniref:uncharacterized protein LOC134205915 n=1 Tax=Armigeres subalbatus TaxID=124917 RepID=UPI002ED07965